STRLTPDAAAQMFVELWTNSPGHFANMTNTRYREVGIGLYLDNGGWWATQLFR
ncbi:MAG: CAP domain-containing protein, partial [Actinomycetota bacterium]